MRSDDTQTQSINFFFINNNQEKYHFFKRIKTATEMFLMKQFKRCK